MSFYIFSYGLTQIEDIFAGKTKCDAVRAARDLIDKWPEYRALEDEEIAEGAENGDLEFDLVEIPEEFPSDCSREHLERIYNHYCSGKVPRPPR